MPNARRARLMQAIRETVAAAPEGERLELELALEDYETTYARSMSRIAPLFRNVLDAIDYGIDDGHQDAFDETEKAETEARKA